MPADLAQMAMMAQPGAMMSPTVREAADQMPLTSEKIAQSMDVDTESPEFLTGSVLAPGPPGSSAVKLAKAGTVAKNLAGALPVVGSMKKVFTSPAVKAVSEIKQNKMPANKWISQMKSRGVKQDELTWTGVEDWLKSQDKSVTKQDLDEYLEANQIQVQEVLYGEPSSKRTGIVLDQDIDEDNIYRIFRGDDPDGSFAGTQGEIIFNEDKNTFEINVPELPRREFADLQSASDFVVQNTNFGISDTTNLTSYGRYTLPGGENYRELLLTLPSKKMVDPVKRYDELNDIAARRNLTEAEEAEMLAIENQQFNQESGTVGRDFVSGHYKEPNIVAHIRVNERVDADGKKVLFIEEIQSDWAQKGRKEGFLTKKQERTQSLIDEKDKMVARAETGMSESGGTFMRIQADDLDRYNEIEKLLAEIPSEDYPGYQAGLGSKVPAAPFVMDTNQWTSLALKRMVRWATDNDFDQIAWTTGKQQAKRYDLSKQVSSLEWRTLYKGSDNGDLSAFDLNGNEILFKQGIKPEEVPDYIGKEASEKLLNNPTKTRKSDTRTYPETNVLEGVDLEVGGEGMGAFYDKILVDRAKKLGKQYGSKVEKGDIGITNFDVPRSYGISPDDNGTFKIVPESTETTPEGDFIIGEPIHRNIKTLEEAQKILKQLEKLPTEEVWTMNLTDKLKKAAKDGLPYYVALPPIVAGVASQQAEASEVKKPAVQVKSNRIMEKAMP